MHLATIVFPLKDWHTKHMKEVVCAYICGDDNKDENQSKAKYQKNMKKSYYASLGNCCSAIDYDIRHGVTKKDVLKFLKGIRKQRNQGRTRMNKNFKIRIKELETHVSVA